MTYVEIDGIDGSLACMTAEQGCDLAATLLRDGYGVQIDSTPVRLEHCPGYDIVVWLTGESAGQSVAPRESTAYTAGF